MNCDGIREVAHEYLQGNLEPDQAKAMKGHLATCAGCADDLRETQSALSLLKSLPEIDPAPETWKKIEARLPAFSPSEVAPRRGEEPVAVVQPAAGKRVFRFWLRTAAAASILVAVASFATLLMVSRTKALPVIVDGKAWDLRERYTAEKFNTLIIPDVGTLKVNKNASLRFENNRSLVLESGEVFADILPSGKGFQIRSGDSTVRVKGTKFGVTAPATVYVVEGAVEVRSPRGSVNLGPRQAAVGSTLTEISVDDYLQWLARHERPDVRLTLDPRDRTTITPGAPLKWNLILETDALAPLTLGKPRDVSQFLSLQIDQTTAPIDATRVTFREARPAANGLMRLDVSHPCVIECEIDPRLFREKGRATVRAVFTSGTHAPENVWVGTVRSQPVTVEVK